MERVWETVTDLSRQDWRSDVARVETAGEDVTPKRAWMRPFAAVYLKKQQRQYLADLREALDL